MKTKFLYAIIIGLLAYVGYTYYKNNLVNNQYETLLEVYKQEPSKWPTPDIDENVNWQELGMLPKPKFIDSLQSKEEIIELGYQLFFDPRLSESKQISCASCHHPDQNWTDNRTVSVGHNFKQGSRNAPSISNLSHSKFLFWDGRSNSLEHQVHFPLNDNVEMNAPNQLVEQRVSEIKGYKTKFKQLYNIDSITITEISHAIGAFERTIVSRKSKFDRFLEGEVDLNENELNGLHLFRTKARCMNCHNGPLFTDHQFHNIGLTYYGRKYEDLGRYKVTKKADDVGKFRTASLRDVMFTEPWMHNGLFSSMEGILNMYSEGMPQPKPKAGQEQDTLFPKTSPLLKELNLTQKEKQDIIAFLNAISKKSYRKPIPELPE